MPYPVSVHALSSQRACPTQSACTPYPVSVHALPSQRARPTQSACMPYPVSVHALPSQRARPTQSACMPYPVSVHALPSQRARPTQSACTPYPVTPLVHSHWPLPWALSDCWQPAAPGARTLRGYSSAHPGTSTSACFAPTPRDSTTSKPHTTVTTLIFFSSSLSSFGFLAGGVASLAADFRFFL